MIKDIKMINFDDVTRENIKQHNPYKNILQLNNIIQMKNVKK